MTAPLKPLNLPCKLAQNPGNNPKYAVEVKTKEGKTLKLGDPQVTRALVAIMDLHAVNGGAASHWGGPAALAEIMSSVHGLIFDRASQNWGADYNFINDAGHTENGVYALRANLGFDNLDFNAIKKFRSIESKLTGHGESHLNPEGVLFSNGPLGSSVAQAQGICHADKITGKKRSTVLVVSDAACMEGEAKEAFCAIPGFAQKSQMNPFVMIITDNNTKLSGRIDEDAFSMNPSFESLETLGWKVIKQENGHDLQKVFSSIEQGLDQAEQDPTKPVAVWVKTVKGYGVKSTQENKSGGHGFPIKKGDAKFVDFVDEIFNGKTPDEFKAMAKEAVVEVSSSSGGSSVPKEKVQAGLARGAIKAAGEGFPVYSISADLQGSTGIAAFQKEFKDRYIEVGVAESNMVSMGAGAAKSGLIPIVDTFAQFGVTKGNLPLTMATLSQAPVIAMFSHAGFQDAADGASHQATTYLSAVSSIPYTKVVYPASSEEAEVYMYEAIKEYAAEKEKGKNGHNIIFFVGRENFPQYLEENRDYKWGKAQVLTEGNDVVLVATGPMVPKALAASKALKAQGVNAAVINNAFVNNVDIETIFPLVEKAGGRVVSIEDHQLTCGMGAQLCHALTLSGLPLKMRSLAMKGAYGQSGYQADQLYEKYDLTPEALVKCSLELLN